MKSMTVSKQKENVKINVEKEKVPHERLKDFLLHRMQYTMLHTLAAVFYIQVKTSYFCCILEQMAFYRSR